MIHELLFNLWHNPGNAVIMDDGDWTHLFEMPEFLHPGETKLLHMIIQIGMDYHKINSFLDEVQNQNYSSEPGSNKFKSGLYLRALCNGVDEVLEDYRKEIIELENKFLEFPQLSLTFILSSVEKFRGLFGLLKTIIRKIQVENLHGCLLISGLHKHINCGIAQIEKATNTIIRALNKVFYQHLCNWIVYGNLLDNYNEFFICDGKAADENFLYPEQLIENASAYSKKSKIKRPPPVRKFYINWDLVPTFITEDTAESILFMGRIVWIVRNDPKQLENTLNYKTTFTRDVWEDKHLEYYNKIRCLEDEPFNGVEFKRIIEECRVKLTKYLWSVMLDEGNLIMHLKLIREYYALGRGELFQQFLAVAAKNVKNYNSELVMQQLNMLFQETARKIYGENDQSYMRFELTSTKTEMSKLPEDPWENLQLNFEIEWPLHIVFHPEVIKFYNKLFNFLMRLKRTQINLFKLWSSHTLSKQRIDKRIWTLRQNLMFLVNNLQYYIQVNIIEAQFSILLKAVEKANEFEDVIKIHHEFVTNLLTKTFVLTPDEAQESTSKHRLYQMPALQHNVPNKVYNVIIKLLELCDKFCLSASMWSNDPNEIELEALETLQKSADITIESLLFVLYSLHEKVKGGHLLQLLLNLDFNRYFSKNKTDLNLTAALGVYS